MKIVFAIIIYLTSNILIAQGKWHSLFNGKNLDGWEIINGTADYEIDNGTIVGITRMGTPNTFLATEKMYGDFILEMDVWVDPKINSGIQFRSISEEDIMNGKVHGYQFDLDPSDRKWSGGIYDEARRGWIYPLTENAKGGDAFRNGQWNHIRIEAIGHEIRTWINDVQCANLRDDLTSTGFIALQVHSISDVSESGKKIKWKNIKILTEDIKKNRKPSDTHIAEYNYVLNELSESEKRKGWYLLWDGQTFNGWHLAKTGKTPIGGNWKINNGILTIEGGQEPERSGDIFTYRKFSDFELIVDFKIEEKANSGIKYFIDENLLEKGESIGLEYQILDDNLHPDAKQGKNGNRTTGSLYDLIRAENLSEKSNMNKRFFENQWNRAKIVVRGSQVEHWLNNVKILEYDRHSQAFRALIEKSKYEEYESFGQWASGRILLQDHRDTVHFKNIKVREL